MYIFDFLNTSFSYMGVNFYVREHFDGKSTYTKLGLKISHLKTI
jgi:hypothetical protein